MSTIFKPRVVDGVRFANYQNCAINLWKTKSYDVRLVIRELDELVGQVSSQYLDGPVLMTVVASGSTLPDSAQRKEIEAFLTRWGASWRAIAYVSEGTDLWSITSRAVMTGLRLIQRRSCPSKVFAEVSEAGEWASDYILKPEKQTTGDTAQALVTLVEELRRMG